MLEIPKASVGEVEARLSKAAAVAEHYRVGMSLATDVVMIVLGMAMSWNTTEAKIRNPHDEDSSQPLREHRTAVVTAVTSVTNPLLGQHKRPRKCTGNPTRRAPTAGGSLTMTLRRRAHSSRSFLNAPGQYTSYRYRYRDRGRWRVSIYRHSRTVAVTMDGPYGLWRPLRSSRGGTELRGHSVAGPGTPSTAVGVAAVASSQARRYALIASPLRCSTPMRRSILVS